MDLNRLKIERGLAAGRRRSGRRSRWPLRVAAIAAAVVLLWLFQTPIRSWIDRLRLSEVETAEVLRSNPAQAAAVEGAASNGYIVARTRAALSADTPGRIVELNVREGQAVPKGFVVARLYSDEYAAALRRDEAELEVGEKARSRTQAELGAAESELRRLESAQDSAAAAEREAQAQEKLAVLSQERVARLVASGDETKQRLDEAEAELESSRARVALASANLSAAAAAAAQAKSRVAVASAARSEAEAKVGSLGAVRDLARATLEKTEVRAPFDGVVVLKDAEVGEVVSPNSQAGSNARGSVVTMVDFNSLEVQAEVPETTLASVKIGAPARIFLDAYPQKSYRGRVDRIWPTANRQKATVEVRVVFEETDDLLRPEMGARVVFLSAPDAQGYPSDAALDGDVLFVPQAAIVRSDGQSGAFVIERDVARFRVLELGERSSDRVVVRRGLDGGERVVLNPPASLDDGDRVREKRSR